MAETILEQVIEQSARLGDRTRKMYLGAVGSFLEFAGTDPRRWNGLAVQDWRDSLRRGRKPQTVNLYLAGLRFATKRIAELNANPALDFARVAETLKAAPEAERRPLSVAQARALVSACKGSRPADTRDRAIVVLFIRTGLRLAGLASILIENCHGNEINGIMLKGGRLHTLYLDGEALRTLRAWISFLARKGVRTGAVFRRLSRPRVDGGVAVGAGLSNDGLYKIVKARARRAGLEGVFPHILRHTFVSWALEAGEPGWKVRRVTGQKSEASMEKYLKQLDGAEAKVSASLPSLTPEG